MTLIEMLIAMGICSMLLAVLMMLSVFTARSFGAISNYCALDKASRRALDEVTMLVRESDGVATCTTNMLVLSYHDADLTFFYDSNAKTLTETYTNYTKKLLDGCDTLTFTTYQRNPVGGSYDNFPSNTDVNAAKIVQVSWICSRKLLGNLINTESIQSAKIVIRKQ
jgi:hypothetical protein